MVLCRYGETFDLKKHPQVCFILDQCDYCVAVVMPLPVQLMRTRALCFLVVHPSVRACPSGGIPD